MIFFPIGLIDSLELGWLVRIAIRLNCWFLVLEPTNIFCILVQIVTNSHEACSSETPLLMEIVQLVL